jgi:DNA-binding NarL/FixJ family response regulator
MKPIRILLADDHHVVRAGLKALLQEEADFEVVGDTHDGDTAVRMAGELNPDVVVMDIAMPGFNGLQALEGIRAAQPASRVIMLSMHDSEEHVMSALRLGAAGYVLKNAAPQELALAIRAAVDGGTWLPAAVSRQMVDAYLTHVRTAERPDGLTARQLEVLKLVAEGRRSKEIAFALQVSVKTVETFRAQIMNKLGIQDIPGLVRYAIRNGISEL